MAVDVIPSGSSVVVDNENDCAQWVTTMCAIKDAEADSVRTTKDAEAQLAKQVGAAYADTVKTVKDAQADLSHQLGDDYADIVKSVRDAQAQVERAGAANTIHLVQDIKDAESRSMKDRGDKFINTIQDIKDFEARATKDRGDKFIDTIQDIKDAAKEAALASCHVEAEMLKGFCHTNESVAKGFAHTNENLKDVFRELEKTAYQNQLSNVCYFKDQALLSEKLAAHQALLSEKLAYQASKELSECCCELKERIESVKDDAKNREIAELREKLTEARLLGRRFRTFSPVVPGTLQASDED
jgi:hypothetical protein